MKNRILSLLAFSMLPLMAAPDTVDASFAATAGAYYDANQYGGAASMWIQPDGKLLLGSNEMSALGGTIFLPLTRINPDGSIDNTFNADSDPNGSGSGIYYDSAGWPEVHGIAVQSDGKIIAVGCMQGVRDGISNPASANSLISNGIVRILPDGTPDTSFQSRGIDTEFIDEVITTDDDKIIIAGGFNNVRNQGGSYVSRYGIARLNADGSLDTSFVVDPLEFGSVVPDSLFIRQVAAAGGGKYYIAGSALPVGGTFSDQVPVFARLLPDGRLDSSFNPAFPPTVTSFSGVVVQPDGKIVALGSEGNTATSVSYIGRFTSTGAVDGSFTLDPSLSVVAARPLRVDPLGRFLVAKRHPTLGNTELIRLNANGSLDATFNASGSWSGSPSGQTQAFFNQSITAPSGRIYAGGAFDIVNGVPTVKITAFEGDLIPATVRFATSLAESAESAGKLRVRVDRIGDAGAAASVSISTSPGTATSADFTALSTTLSWAAGDSSPRVVEIDLIDDALPEGDETFTVHLSGATGAVLQNSTTSVTLLDDEALPVILAEPVSLSLREGLVAEFSVRASSVLPLTYQWQKNGVDVPGATSRILSFAALAGTEGDYRVIVSNTNGNTSSAVASLTVIPPSVVVDVSFSFSGVAKPGTMTKLADGSFLILDGDAFTGYTLRKFTSTFTVDPTFVVTTTPLTGFNASSAFPNVIPLPNGQWLAQGFFQTINGVTRPQIARMNADGSVDESFTPDFSAGLSLRGVSVTADGDLYAMVLNPSQGNRLQRFLPNGSFDPNFDITSNYSTNGRLYKAIKLADGSLLISYAAGFGGSFSRGIRKLNPNGTLASGFVHSSNLTGGAGVSDFFLLPDGRIAALYANTILIYDAAGVLQQTITFVGNPLAFRFERGHFVVIGVTSYNGVAAQGGMVRIGLDGSLAPNFPGGAGPNGLVSQLIADAAGRYLALGDFTTWNSVSAPKLTRLIPTAPEAGFQSYFLTGNEGATLTARIERYGDTTLPASVRVQSIAGTALSGIDFSPVDQVITWAAGESGVMDVPVILIDDELIEGDLTFTLTLSEASNLTAIPLDLTIRVTDPDSLPQISGNLSNLEVLEDGTLSLSVTSSSPTAQTYQWFFNGEPLAGSTAATLTRTPMTVDKAGSYFVEITNNYGKVVSSSAQVTMVKSPAKIAPTFVPVYTTLGNGWPTEVVALPDGSALVGGTFIFQSGGVDYSRLARILPNGSLDPAFLPVINGAVDDIHLLNDGSFLIVGSFTTVNGVNSPKLARFNADLTFDSQFATQVGTGPGTGTLSSVVARTDGKIAVAGNFTDWNSASLSPNRDLILLNADGSFSAAYPKTITNNAIYAMALVPGTNEIITTHAFPVGSSRPIFRWAEDRSLISNYNPTALYRPDFNSVAFSNDGSLLLGGEYSIRFDLATQAIITNYNLAFSQTIAEQVDGRVIVGGSYTPNRISRFRADGSVDPLFVPGTGFSNTVFDTSISRDGSIWAVGNFTIYNGVTARQVVRLTGNTVAPTIVLDPASVVADPGEDVTFTADARSTEVLSYQWFKGGDLIPGATNPSLQLTNVDESNEGDYTVTVTNQLGADTSAVASLTVRGAPEIVTLSSDLTLIEGSPLSLSVSVMGANPLSYQWTLDGAALVDDGNITGSSTATLSIASTPADKGGAYRVVVTNTLGNITSDAVNVTVTLNPAAMAPGFVPPTIVGNVKQVLPLPDGRALIGGDFTSITDGINTAGPRLAVVDQTGAVIPLAGLSADKVVDALRFQSDGKILIAGNFTNIGATNRQKVARLNADLSLDTTFAPLGLAGEFFGVFDIAEEASGTIMVVGGFADYDGLAGTSRAFRLNSDGSFNSTFTSGAGGDVYRVLPQSDGDLIFTGAFFSWADTAEEFLIRTDSSGTFDPSVDYNTGFIYLYEALELANGDLIAANGFNGTLIRYTSAGVRVNPPLTGTLNGVVDAFAEDAEANLYLGGRFTFAGGQSRNRLARYGADGVLDDGFLVGTGFDADVKDVKIAHNGAIWVGGNFTSYNGITASKLVLLRGSASVEPNDPFEEFVAGLPVDQRGPDDDPDGDRLSNLLEFVYGTDPSSWASRLPPIFSSGTGPGRNLIAIDPSAAVDPNKPYFSFTFRLPKDTRGVTLTPQATRYLANFEDGSATLIPVGPPVDDGDFTLQKYYFSPNATAAGAGFVRVKATR